MLRNCYVFSCAVLGQKILKNTNVIRPRTIRLNRSIAVRFAVSVMAVFGVSLLSLAASGAAFAASAPPMSVPGKFSVNSRGAATYSIPITTPPGTAGIAPVLSLDYSSQSGDGIVGLGWMLSGLESIERCPRTLAQDGVHGGVNYDANDRFCFEGQRLVAVSGTYGASGTEYRTELESFSKIVSYGTSGTGPTYFKVWTKSGQIMEFGNSSDSRILTTSGSGTARSWALNKVSDVKGNYYSVTYINDTTNGQTYPSRIDYTGNSNTSLSAYNSIRFVYNTARPDSATLYHGGSYTKTTVLLSNVQAYAGSSLVYDYQLTYELGTSTRHSRLTTVTLCDGSGNCLAPTTLGWQGTRDAISIAVNTYDYNLPNAVLGDFNGDGLADVIYTSSTATTDTSPAIATFGMHFGAADSVFSPNFSSLTTFSPTASFIKSCPYSGCTLSGAAQTMTAIDDTGSGVLDLMYGQLYKRYVYEYAGGMDVSIDVLVTHLTQNALANTNSFSGDNIVGSQTSSTDFNLPYSYAGDFNGDGRTEYVGVLSSGDGTFTTDSNHPLPSNFYTSGFDMFSGDFDGDGCSDLLTQSSSDHLIRYYCSPNATSASVPYWSGSQIITGDFNGDGLTDVLVVPSSGSGTLYFSTGAGLTDSGFTVPSSWAGAYSYLQMTFKTTGAHELLAGDVNGDGKTDIVEVSTTSINIYLSTGNGFVLSYTLAAPSSISGVVLGDTNNDGIPDLKVGFTVYTFSYTPELLTSISNGLGATTTITYDRLNTNGSFYTKCPNNSSSYICGDSYPTQSVDGPIYAVSQIATSNGIGGVYKTSYSYAGYKTDLKGRGSLGFARVVATDQQTGIVQTTNYHQDFPYTGMVSSQTKVVNSVTLSSVTSSYADNGLGNGSEGVTRHYVSLSQSAAVSNDLDGTTLPTETTSYTYDSYGNALTVNDAVSDGSSKVTTNSYSNDATNWLLGRLTGTSVSRTVPSGNSALSNSAPAAANDSVSADTNIAKTFDPRSNDSDPNGDALSIIAVSAASHGTVVINNGASLTYKSAAQYAGSDSFTYTISDGHGHIATASVSVTVTDSPPVAADDVVATDENTAVTFDPRKNDSDINNDPLTITAVGTPSHGTVSYSGTSITYTPTTYYSGSDSFSYTISDGMGHTESATITMHVAMVNQAPSAANDSVTTNENTAVTFNPLSNDSDPDADTLTISAVGSPSHGAVTNNGTTLTYTPKTYYYGTDSFTYTISDGNGHTATATVTVTIVNRAPSAANDTASTNKNIAVTIYPLSNDSDPDGDTLSISAVGSPSHGSVSNNGTSLTYTPVTNYSGTDSFSYTASDGQGHTASASVTVTVNYTNAAPSAANDSVTVNENSSVTFDPRSNDSDGDGDTLTISAVGSASHGSVVNNGTSITYTPTTNYYGSDSFTYTISDGNGGSSSATVSVTISRVNIAPVAVNDSCSAKQQVPSNTYYGTCNVLANDTDADGDTLTIVSVTQPSKGSVGFSGNLIVYVNSNGSSGFPAKFTYTISDGNGHTSTATVTVN